VSVAPAGATIQMASGTCPETSSLHIPISLTIDGQGTAANPVILDGQSTDTIADVSLSSATVTMDNLTISRGGSPFGEAVFNNGTVTLANDAFAAGQRALFNNGTATMTDVTVTGNSASVDGPAMFNSGIAYVIDSTISANSTGGDGGPSSTAGP